jgi:hypothetical protein
MAYVTHEELRVQLDGLRGDVRRETKIMIDEAIAPVSLRMDQLLVSSNAATTLIAGLADSINGSLNDLRADTRSIGLKLDEIRAVTDDHDDFVSSRRAIERVMLSAAATLPVGTMWRSIVRFIAWLGVLLSGGALGLFLFWVIAR